MHFTEDMFEQAVIELFENMGYTHIYAPDMERDYSSPLLDAVLLDSLVKLNKGLSLDAINEAISKLRNFDTGSLLQKNMQFIRKLFLIALEQLAADRVNSEQDPVLDDIYSYIVREAAKQSRAVSIHADAGW